MPAPEANDLNQWAVYWPFGGYDDYGQPVVGVPLEIPCRWLTKRTEMQDAQGNTVVLDATAVVDRVIHPGSHMWLGELADWLGTGSSTVEDDEEVMGVKTFREVPDVKGREVRRTVGLMRLRARA